MECDGLAFGVHGGVNNLRLLLAMEWLIDLLLSRGEDREAVTALLDISIPKGNASP